MRVNKITEIPSGFITTNPTDPKYTIENVELRCTLEKAIDDANLNATERMALNKQFYPDGGGFAVFTDDGKPARFNIFYNKEYNPETDSFTREIKNIKLPEYANRVEKRSYHSSKSNFQANLDNALKKLKKVLKGIFD